MAKQEKKHGVKLPPRLLRGRGRKVKHLKPGQGGFISSDSVVVLPKTRETWVWTGAAVLSKFALGPSIHIKMVKDGVSLRIPSNKKLEPGKLDPKETYLPVVDIKIVDLIDLMLE